MKTTATVLTYIGLGSNLNNPRKQLQLAIEHLQDLPLSTLIKISSFYNSTALVPPERPNEKQPDFVNAVVAMNTQLNPFQLLECCQKIESTMGRVRTGKRWEARVIDLDILLFGEQCINTPELIIPHPEMQNRDFVLEPLTEVRHY